MISDNIFCFKIVLEMDFLTFSILIIDYYNKVNIFYLF